MEGDMIFETKEIMEQIRLHGHVEWRSKKNLDEFILSNTFEKDFCIVGYASAKTMLKWGLKLHRETPTADSPHDVYIAIKNNRIYYLHGLVPPNDDHSRFYRYTYP